MNIPDAYRQFFLKSEEGQHFMKALDQMIDNEHSAAERTPENARDFTQRAKGIRSVKEHIQVATTKPKKGATPKQS